MTDADRLHILEATSTCGLTIRTGPVDIAEGVILVDRHLAPNGWAPRFLPITPANQAIAHFTAARNRWRRLTCSSRSAGRSSPTGTTTVPTAHGQVP